GVAMAISEGGVGWWGAQEWCGRIILFVSGVAAIAPALKAPAYSIDLPIHYPYGVMVPRRQQRRFFNPTVLDWVIFLVGIGVFLVRADTADGVDFFAHRSDC